MTKLTKIIYRHRFRATCPNNGNVIKYTLEIQSYTKIMVEEIVTVCKMLKNGFHEDIAEDLGKRFGEFQILTAHHHGVDIETRWGAL